MTGQMYVEKLVPADGCTQPYPLVFMAGGSQTGTVSVPFESFLPNKLML
jgi:hypothetical protein